ncbi:MAG: DeoR/GlpR family DNA-binding transcription regulator [Firmicutes bacterium]|nr:DeoR/GlpR family DNA-binding transcription regulator [Bacillota bacterium]
MMLADERQRLICRRLREQGQVQVGALAQEFSVSEETVRRDIALLERNHLLRRVHGGALPVQAMRLDPPFEARAAENREERMRLGRAAAALVGENEIIAMDGGVTTEAMAEAMSGCRGVTVVTASVPVLCLLMNKKRTGEFEGSVYFLGGLLDEREQMTGGALTAEHLERFSFDRVFVSATAADSSGIYMGTAENGALAAGMIARARETVLLAGSEKFGRRSVYRYAEPAQLNTLVTDAKQPLPAGMTAVLEQSGVRIIIA